METMNAKPYTLNDLKLRLMGIPLISALISASMHAQDFRQMNERVAMHLFIGIGTTLLIWEGNRLIMIYMRRTFPNYSQTTMRLMGEGALGLMYTFIATYLLDEVIYKAIFDKQIDAFTGFRTSLIPTVMVYLVYETIYFFEA